LRLMRHVTVADGSTGQSTSDAPVGGHSADSDDLPPQPGAGASTRSSPPAGGVLAATALFGLRLMRHVTVADGSSGQTTSDDPVGGHAADSDDLPPAGGGGHIGSGAASGGATVTPFGGLRLMRHVTVADGNSGQTTSDDPVGAHPADSDDLPPAAGESKAVAGTGGHHGSGATALPGLRLMRHVTVADASSGQSTSDAAHGVGVGAGGSGEPTAASPPLRLTRHVTVQDASSQPADGGDAGAHPADSEELPP